MQIMRARSPRELPHLEALPEGVVRALRAVQTVQRAELEKLTPMERRQYAAAEHLCARYEDLQAQIDALQAE